MLVSIIIALHNSEAYIADTLRSLQKQTYKEFECLLVDDNSTDNTVNIVLDRFCKKDARFKLYSGFVDNSTKHLNDAFTVRYMFNLPKAKYTIHLDSDDLYEDNMIAKFVEFIEMNPEYDAVCSDLHLLREQDDLFPILEEIAKEEPVPQDKVAVGHEPRSWEDKEFNRMNAYQYSLNLRIWSNQCYIIKTDVLKKLNSIIAFENICYGDYIFWCNAIAEGCKLYKLSDRLCYYNIHKGSISEYYEFDVISLYVYIYSRARMVINAYKRGEFKDMQIDSEMLCQWHINRVKTAKEDVIRENYWDKITDRYKEELNLV